jgi:hypothetical protein
MKTFYGYSEKKIQQKADKRGISFDAYKTYLINKRRFMLPKSQRKPKDD